MKLIFTRKEFKYHVPNFLLNDSIKYFSDRLDCDKFIEGNKPYVVRSIYYDSLTFRHYAEKVNGDPYKKKIRVRTYGQPEDNNPTFLEIKNKKLEKIHKERVHIDKKLDSFLETHSFSTLRPLDSDVVEKCLFDQKKYNVRPKVLVFYRRIAFIDPTINFKVNMDFDIKTYQTRNLLTHEKLLRPVFKDRFILEIKYEDYVPNYYKDYVMRHNLQRMPFSKYSTSVENCYRN